MNVFALRLYRFLHGQSHILDLDAYKSHASLSSGMGQRVNLVIIQCIFDSKHFESSCEVMNILHILHASHVTLPLDGNRELMIRQGLAPRR